LNDFRDEDLVLNIEGLNVEDGCYTWYMSVKDKVADWYNMETGEFRRRIAFGAVQLVKLSAAGVDIVWGVAVRGAPIRTGVEELVDVAVAVSDGFQRVITTADVGNRRLVGCCPVKIVDT
jgi:orotate phosphoribosyltransferase-like protein